MTAVLEPLSITDEATLRELTRQAEDVEWPSEVARTQGWRVANAEYHQRQRDLGRREMRQLMAFLHVAPGVDPERAQQLVVTATRLFLQTEAMRMVSRVKDGEVRVFATRCPLYDRFLDHSWGGLTACGCFSRREGWFDALEAGLEQDLIMNRKWGDPVCQVAVRVKSPVGA